MHPDATGAPVVVVRGLLTAVVMPTDPADPTHVWLTGCDGPIPLRVPPASAAAMEQLAAIATMTAGGVPARIDPHGDGVVITVFSSEFGVHSAGADPWHSPVAAPRKVRPGRGGSWTR